MKIYKGWYDKEEEKFYKNKLVLDGEENLVLTKVDGLSILGKFKIVVTNFHFVGIPSNFFQKVKTVYTVVKYIFGKVKK